MDNESIEKGFNLVCKRLDYKMLTKKQARDYLIQKGFDCQVVDEVMARLIDYNLVNDEHYAQVYCDEVSKKYGAKRIKQKLYSRGIVDAEFELSGDEELLVCVELCEKYMKYKEDNEQNQRKLIRFLLGRGFDYDTALKAIGIIKGEDKL